MFVWLFGFCAGVMGAALVESFLWISPSLWLLGCLSLFPKTRLLGGLAIGFLYFAYHVQPLIDSQFPICVSENPNTLTLVVVTSPKRIGEFLRFDGEITRSDSSNCSISLPARVRVTWQTAENPELGAMLTGEFKLRPVHGFSNRGGFDFERWMFAQKHVGSAFVLSATLVAGHASSPVAHYRQKLRRLLLELNLKHPGVQWALASGDTGLLGELDWTLFRSTGTIHLMIVSGFHVSLVAGIGVSLFRLLSLFLPSLYLSVGRHRLSLIGGGFAAVAYVLFVGVSNSSLRALVQTVAVLLFLYIGRRIDPLRAFVLALSIVLVVDPLATLKAGFWFSFLAVWALIVRFGGASLTRNRFSLFIAAQLVVLFSLAPVMITLNGGVTLVAPIANVVLIPIVSLVVVPLSLLGIALLPSISAVAELLLEFNDLVVSFCYWYMKLIWQISELPLPPVDSTWLMLVSLAAALGILLPGNWWQRGSSVLLYIVCLWPVFEEIPVGEVKIQVLDVGQGEALLVDTRAHRLIFDTGPKYVSGFDVGKAVVVPAFRATGSPTLDMLIVSHGDIDHSGGMPFVVKELKPEQILVGSDLATSVKNRVCRRERHWRWDGVDFRLLHPGKRWVSRNNGSCVLLISTKQTRVLVTGDIDKLAEYTLVYRGLPQLDLLVVAHHGSRSSSSERFVAATKPRISIVSVGRGNRFGHPHEEVVARLVTQGSEVVLTHVCGAAEWRSWQKRNIICNRSLQPRFWRRYLPVVKQDSNLSR